MTLNPKTLPCQLVRGQMYMRHPIVTIWIPTPGLMPGRICSKIRRKTKTRNQNNKLHRVKNHPKLLEKKEKRFQRTIKAAKSNKTRKRVTKPDPVTKRSFLPAPMFPAITLEAVQPERRRKERTGKLSGSLNPGVLVQTPSKPEQMPVFPLLKMLLVIPRVASPKVRLWKDLAKRLETTSIFVKVQSLPKSVFLETSKILQLLFWVLL